MGRGETGMCPARGAFFRPCRDSWRWGHVARAYPRMNPWAIACRLSEAGVGGVLSDAFVLAWICGLVA
jgi:hypothetical protein